MREGVEATLTRTIACTKCGKLRHVCVADKNEVACATAMNFERKHGICPRCEREGSAANPTYRRCPQSVTPRNGLTEEGNT
jgi:hypothetical protein